jgi:hypothetical protein
MTRISVPYRLLGLAAAAFAAVLSSNVYSQSGRATLIGATAGQQTCSYSTIAMQPTGQIDITCTPSTPSGVATIGFSLPSYAPVTKDATTNATLNISLVGVGTASTLVSATMTASGTCNPTPASQTVQFAAGTTVTSATYQIIATSVGVCNLALTNITAGATPGTVDATIQVNAATVGGGGPPPPAGCPATPANVVVNSMAGQSVGQHVRDNPVGSIQSYPLPRTRASGAALTDAVIGYTPDTVWTPSSLGVEVSISKCPGDIAAYKALPPISNFGVSFYPCGKNGGGEGLSLNWTMGQTGGSACNVPAGEQWFINWRIVSGCPAGQACGQLFYWN